MLYGKIREVDSGLGLEPGLGLEVCAVVVMADFKINGLQTFLGHVL